MSKRWPLSPEQSAALETEAREEATPQRVTIMPGNVSLLEAALSEPEPAVVAQPETPPVDPTELATESLWKDGDK